MRIGFVTSDADRVDGELLFAGTGWYRAVLPARELKAHGHEVVVANSIVQHPDGSLQPVDVHGDRYTCDVVVLQRWMKYGAPDAIGKAVAVGQVVVNDVDDWFLGIPTSNQAFLVTHPRFDKKTNVLVTRADARKAKTGISTENRQHFLKGLAQGSAITVSTQHLLDKMSEHYPRLPVFLLRNPLDLERFGDPEDVSDGPNIGWTGGIPWRGSDLTLLKGVLGPFCEKHDLRFVHGGNHPQAPEHQTAAFQLGLDPGRVERRDIVPIYEYRQLLRDFDIGVVPLDLTSFAHAKSALKGMEFSAAGIPFIASPTMEYEHFCDGWGLLARKPKQWTSHLERLMEPEERVRLGKMGRERVERESITKRWAEWETVYRELVA